MTSVKKITAIAALLLFAGGSVTLYAQVPQTSQPMSSPAMNQSPTPMQSPPMSPADQSPNSPMGQPQTGESSSHLNLDQPQTPSKISDKDLKEFAAVYTKVKAEGQKAQQKMAAVIEKDGMKLERFNAIQTAKLQNQKSDAGPEEMKTFDKITGDLDAMQPEIQKGMEAVIQSSGMTVDKFQAIATAIQTDKDVQARFRKMMGDGGSPS